MSDDFIDSYQCPLKRVELMEEWMKKDPEGECRPCRLAPLAGWYIEELKESGHSDVATRLQNAFEDGKHLTISRELDYAKSVVGEPLKAKLEKYDCLCQASEQD